MKYNYRFIVLVIANHDELYEDFKSTWIYHWNNNKQQYLHDCECFYLYNDENQTEKVIRSDNDLYFPFKETYPAPGLLLKTIGALEYLNDNEITYDIILRTNLSSLINWKSFSEFIDKNISNQYFYAGVLYKDKHMSGCCMIMSSYIANILLENKNSFNYDEPDDVAINLWLLSSEISDKIDYQYIDSIRPNNDDELSDAINKNIIHFRFHAGYTNENIKRIKDHRDMKKIMSFLDKITEYFTQIKENFTQIKENFTQTDNECNLNYFINYFIIGLIIIVVTMIFKKK